MRRRLRPALLSLLASALALLVASCAAGRSEGAAPGEPQPRFTAIAVYPFGFRWEEPAYRSFELSSRLISVVMHGTRNSNVIFGPGEFRVHRLEDDNVFAASTLGSVLPATGIPLKKVLVIRPWAERRIHTASKTTINSRGNAVAAERNDEVTYVGHVEVIDAASRQRLFELTDSRVADPFAERDDDGADPAPELTELMEHLVAQATVELQPWLTPSGRLAELPGLVMDVTPHHAFTYSEPGRSAFDAAMVRMDAFEREIFVRQRVRYANPFLRPEDIDPMVKVPGGLFVRETGPGQPLAVGDVIVEVNGDPAFPQAIIRARLLKGADSVRIRRASGDYETVILP